MVRRLSRIAKAILAHIAAVSQGKVRLLAEKYDVAEWDVMWWAGLDPTPNGKYLEWIVRRVKDNNIRLPEDGDRVKQALQDFQVLTQKKRTREQYQVNPDIGVYTLHDIEDFGDKLHGREQRPESLAKIPEGAEKVYDDGVYSLVKVTDADTACALASGTKWCTSDAETAQDYLDRGPLHVIYKNGEKIGQTDGTDVMDLRDRGIFMEDNPELFKILFRAGAITDFGEILDPFMFKHGDSWIQKIEELGFLEELLKHPASAVAYAEARAFEPEYEGENRRLLEAEPVIMQDPWSAVKYAQAILRRRWVAAESTIATDPKASAFYKKIFNIGHPGLVI